MATGARHYGDIRATAQKWLEEVELSLIHIYRDGENSPAEYSVSLTRADMIELTMEH